MRVLSALILLAGLVACGGDSPESSSGDAPDGTPSVDAAALKKARALCDEAVGLTRSDPDRAIELLTASIEAHATADAYLARARAHLALAPMVLPGSMPEAVESDLDAALALEPDHLAALFFKAQRLGLGRGVGQEILARIASLPVPDDDGEGLFLRARAAAGLSDEPEEMIAQAQRDFARAAELRPDDAEVRLRWGSFLIRTVKDEEKAAVVLREAVEIDPTGGVGQAAQRLLDEL